MADGGNLTEDLILQILLKLPVKSLHRCKCVCKSWFHLIQNPNFIYWHLDHYKNNDTILILENLYFENKRTIAISLYSYESISIISPRWMIPCFNFNANSSVVICGPCNGLICVASYQKSFLLCNPSLKESKLLQPYHFPVTSRWRFDPDFIGLGFDTATNDHKFVVRCSVGECRRGERYHPEYKVLVYSLSMDSWREIDTNINLEFRGCNYVGTFFNGTLHWIERRADKSRRLFCFDIKAEVFSYMELPCIDRNNSILLKVVDDSLALFAWKCRGDSSTVQLIEMWVMRKYGVKESWTKQLTVGPVTRVVKPLFLWKNEALIVKTIEDKLASVSIDTGEMNDLDIPPSEATVYQESLVSI